MKDTFLHDFTIEEIDTMLQEVHLRKEGWQFYYAIDPGEIRKYCFPFGLTSSEKQAIVASKEKSYISDEHLLLKKFFDSTTKNQKIIFKEYHEEIRSMTFYYLTHIAQIPLNGPEAFDFFFSQEKEKKSLQQIIESRHNIGKKNQRQQNEVSAQFVENHSSEGLAAVFLLNDGLTRMRELFSEYIEIDLDDIGAITDDIERLDKIYRESPLLSEERIMQLLYAYGIEMERSKRRDSRAIAKVVTANQHLLAEKKVLLFFSDADSSKFVIKQISQELPEFPKYPKPDGTIEHMDLVRSRRQLFSHFLCGGTFGNVGGENYEQTIRNLEQLKEVVKEFNEAKKTSKKTVHDMDFLKKNKMLFNRYITLRQAFEKTGIFFQFEDYLNKAKQIAERSSRKDAIGFMETLIDELETIKENIDPLSNKLTLLINELRFNKLFVEQVSSITANKRQFILNRGQDPVESSYNQLPVCFLIGEKSRYHHIFQQMVKMILDRNVQSLNFNELSKFIEEINQGFLYTDDEFLIKSFMLLMLPDINPNRPTSNNWRAHRRIEDLFKVRYSKINDEIKEELWYVDVWALRRSREYDKSIKTAQLAIHHINSPDVNPKNNLLRLSRFYHGMSLAYFCKYFDSGKADRNINLLEKSIGNCLKAHELYQYVDNFELRQKLQECLLNSLAHQCTLYYVDKNKIDDCPLYTIHLSPNEDIKRAREYLKLLRESVGRQIFYEYPEYNHTESYLEYYESFIETDPLAKLKFSLEAISRAIVKSIEDEVKQKDYWEFKDKVEKRRENILAKMKPNKIP